MGNCGGKPKDLATEREAPVPAEEATAPTAEAVSVPQEQDGGETKKEEPTGETSSEAAQEPAKANEPATEAEPVEKEAVSKEVKPSEPVVAVEAKVEAHVEAKAEAPVATT